jgi:hypothetical protein
MRATFDWTVDIAGLGRITSVSVESRSCLVDEKQRKRRRERSMVGFILDICIVEENDKYGGIYHGRVEKELQV